MASVQVWCFEFFFIQSEINWVRILFWNLMCWGRNLLSPSETSNGGGRRDMLRCTLKIFELRLNINWTYVISKVNYLFLIWFIIKINKNTKQACYYSWMVDLIKGTVPLQRSMCYKFMNEKKMNVWFPTQRYFHKYLCVRLIIGIIGFGKMHSVFVTM